MKNNVITAKTVNMTTAITDINALLAPVLFQVVGTTPESLADSVKQAGLEGKADIGAQLASAGIFAAAVNKNTMEQFIIKPELASVRNAISNQFSIKGSANMTALTLLGHCMYLNAYADKIDFAVQFRKKMGQRSIWDGDFNTGSLSDTQKKILVEKGKSVNKNSAQLFASGFFKYVGADRSRFTEEEALFWDVSLPSAGSSPGRQSSSSSVPGRSRASSYVDVTLNNKERVSLSRKAYDYYMQVNNNDMVRLTASVVREGPAEWNVKYELAADKDVERRGNQGQGTVV